MKKLLKTFALILFLNLAFCDLTIAIVDHHTFIISYIITVFVESVILVLLRYLKLVNISNINLLNFVLGVNFITLALMHFIIYFAFEFFKYKIYGQIAMDIAIILGEIFVILIEAKSLEYLTKHTFIKCLLISILVNLWGALATLYIFSDVVPTSPPNVCSAIYYYVSNIDLYHLVLDEPNVCVRISKYDRLGSVIYSKKVENWARSGYYIKLCYRNKKVYCSDLSKEFLECIVFGKNCGVKLKFGDISAVSKGKGMLEFDFSKLKESEIELFFQVFDSNKKFIFQSPAYKISFSE